MELPEEDSTSSSSSSSESGTEGSTLTYNLRSRESANQTEDQGLQINLAISSGLARLYSMLTQEQGNVILNAGSDSDDEEYLPSFCR